MEIWEPKPPGTLWATPGLLQDYFIFTFRVLLSHCRVNILNVSFKYTVKLLYDSTIDDDRQMNEWVW
jgi:hypothetical protein